jgi:hypothetical protein
MVSHEPLFRLTFASQSISDLWAMKIPELKSHDLSEEELERLLLDITGQHYCFAVALS